MSQILIFLSWAPEATQVPSGWNCTALIPLSWSQKVLMTYLEEKSNSLTVLSSEPEAISLVSGAKVQANTLLLWPWREKRNLRSIVEYTLMVWSLEPASKSCPLGESEMDLTAEGPTLMLWEKPWTELFQSLTVPSSPAEAIIFPGFTTLTSLTAP